VQFTSPAWEDPYDNLDDRRRYPEYSNLLLSPSITDDCIDVRLVTLYQILNDSVHAKSGQGGGPLKLQYIKTEKESVMCWVSVNSNRSCCYTTLAYAFTGDDTV